jgi:hypothetical protein
LLGDKNSELIDLLDDSIQERESIRVLKEAI